MLVKCKGCGTKVDRKEAFKVVVNNKNNYYCNASEYETLNIEKESKAKVLELVFEIIGETTNTAIYKELTDIAKVHTYKKILDYIEENFIKLNDAMNMHFEREYGKIRYFTAIIKNEIGDFVATTEEENDDVLDLIDQIEDVKYKQTKVKSFNDYLDEY